MPAAIKFIYLIISIYLCGSFFALAYFAKKEKWAVVHGKYNNGSDEHLNETAKLVLFFRITGVVIFVAGIIATLIMYNRA